MPSRAWANVGTGLAYGANIAGDARKRYDILLEQNRRSIDYQRLQEYLQNKSQIFRAAENEKLRQQKNEQFMKNYELAQHADQRSDAYMAEQVNDMKSKRAYAEYTKRFNNYKLNLANLQNEQRAALAMYRSALSSAVPDPAAANAAMEKVREIGFRMRQLQRTTGQEFQQMAIPKTADELYFEKAEKTKLQKYRLEQAIGEMPEGTEKRFIERRLSKDYPFYEGQFDNTPKSTEEKQSGGFFNNFFSEKDKAEYNRRHKEAMNTLKYPLNNLTLGLYGLVTGESEPDTTAQVPKEFDTSYDSLYNVQRKKFLQEQQMKKQFFGK